MTGLPSTEVAGAMPADEAEGELSPVAVFSAQERAAVYRAIYSEVNAHMQLQAQALKGPLTFLNEVEGAKADATVMKTISRPWDLWKAQVVIE